MLSLCSPPPGARSGRAYKNEREARKKAGMSLQTMRTQSSRLRTRSGAGSSGGVGTAGVVGGGDWGGGMLWGGGIGTKGDGEWWGEVRVGCRGWRSRLESGGGGREVGEMGVGIEAMGGVEDAESFTAGTGERKRRHRISRPCLDGTEVVSSAKDSKLLASFPLPNVGTQPCLQD